MGTDLFRAHLDIAQPLAYQRIFNEECKNKFLPKYNEL